MKVKIKKLNPSAKLPTYGKKDDGCLDIFAVSIGVDKDDKYLEYDTGLAFEVPPGYVMLVFPRSSISNYDMLLCNSVAVLDSGYRGPLKLRYKRIDYLAPTFYKVGDKIGQIMIIPRPEIEWEEVETLSETERGEGGFGSTGV